MLQGARDESIASALVKADSNPTDLTPAEHRQLDNFYWEAITIALMREQIMQRRGVFDDEMSGDDIDLNAAIAGSWIFDSAYGKAWYEINRADMVAEIRDALDRTRDHWNALSMAERARLINERLGDFEAAPQPTK